MGTEEGRRSFMAVLSARSIRRVGDPDGHTVYHAQAGSQNGHDGHVGRGDVLCFILDVQRGFVLIR